MAFLRLATLVIAVSILVEAKLHQQRKHETIPDMCDPTYSNDSTVQCYCTADPHNKYIVRTAECHLTIKGVDQNHKSWEGFENLKNVTKLTLSNTRGIALDYIPTNAFKIMQTLMKVEIKYGNIENIEAFAFANLSLIEEIILGDNQINVLKVNAFAHLRDLSSLSLDTNNIIEINRNVFVDLPSLEKLYLTNNKITTIHDRAFVHLENLIELEIDRNSIFSLNSETFSGLKKLQKLDLSGNNLEVIGDNTFLPLNDLRTLNLDSNKIQMLDEKAFHGLGKLYALSLAHNNLTTIENVKIFEGLPALSLLSFKSNQLVELKPEVIAPIAQNLYGNATGNLDVEDNKFPCDCRLDWFLVLMNSTQNKQLKLAMENLKCVPSDSLRTQWIRAAEQDKVTSPAFEDESSQGPNTDYEYYDEEQLNGKLFYLDVRDLANCVKPIIPVLPPVSVNEITKPLEVSTKAITSSQTSSEPDNITEYKPSNKAPTSTLESGATKVHDLTINKPNKENETNNKDSYTTTRLATVSAKPQEYNDGFADQDNNMASDEARTERIKAHRSIQDEEQVKHNNAHTTKSVVGIVASLLCFRLYI